MNIPKIIIGSLTVLLVVVTVFPMIRSGETSELIERELVACVVSVCVEDKTIGKRCEILKPKLSRIRLTVDENKHHRVELIPTDIDCR
jgi:hypothetical protein